MKNRLGILFLHHHHHRVFLNNLQSIRRHNPDARIVTISSRLEFDGGYSLCKTRELHRMHRLQPSRSSDLLVCSWYLQHKEQCDKWWIVEWDTYAEMSVYDYYRPVWDYPFIASSVRLLHREPEWFWFSQASDRSKPLRELTVGAVPFLYLLSKEALRMICEELLGRKMTLGNGELRFATAARLKNIPACGFSPPHDKITWKTWRRLSGPPTIFHPVKHFVDYR